MLRWRALGPGIDRRLHLVSVPYCEMPICNAYLLSANNRSIFLSSQMFPRGFEHCMYISDSLLLRIFDDLFF